ncbi:MAG: ribonuclease Z [Pelotomaculum sp. PtaU1.Bin035]|nr:MAG: ribonuclease Z [Pelotomaculum sp. PtaU1.Bin035]
MENVDFKVAFWGVRGSRPVSGPHTVLFGGNTPCVQIQIGERLLIMDAGTGICNLGNQLMKKKGKIKGEIFITHTHWDHIQGFPFFTPAFIKNNHFVLYGQSKMNLTFANLMRGQMLYPHFPVSLEQMGATIEFYEVYSGEEIDLDDGIVVKTAHNNHPGGSISYRLEHGGRACCYITDTEHYSCLDNNLRDIINGADLVIYDTNFTDEEYVGQESYTSKIGWGHSTWQEGVKLMQAAGARKLVLFHHATHRTDNDLAEIERKAQKQYPNCVAAREGMVISLPVY